MVPLTVARHGGTATESASRSHRSNVATGSTQGDKTPVPRRDDETDERHSHREHHGTSSCARNTTRHHLGNRLACAHAHANNHPKGLPVANDPEITPTANALDNADWETVNTGSLGNEWDFERDGPLVGHFLGSRVIETTKTQSGEATALQFAPVANPDDIVFIWESADLGIFSDTDSIIRVGDLVRIAYLGRRQFTAADGTPRQIKQYRVQMPKISN